MEISNSCNVELEKFKQLKFFLNSLVLLVRQYKTVSFDIQLNNKNYVDSIFMVYFLYMYIYI